MSEFAEAIEKLRHCERRMIAAETHATLGCGHHVSNLDRTVESRTALCRLCDLESRCRDAEKQEREYFERQLRLAAFVRDFTDPTPLTVERTEILSTAVATVRRCESRLSGHPANSLEYEAYTAATELLAREFVRLLDAGELWRVKELRWTEDQYGTSCWCSCLFGTMAVERHPAGWSWSFCFGIGSTTGGEPCESLADGKAKCEAEYRARLAAALEPFIVEARP